MFRFLKGIVKREEPARDLDIGEVPAWIEGEERQVRDALAARVRDHRAVILDARGEMEAVLSGFEEDSREVSRTKLAGVTERSLPLFLRALRTSLSHDLPGDPEGFYAAAGEVLKGCLSAFRGQGRYLASRFPEEMKMLRDGVDTLGREVNALTPEIARARERLRGLAELRTSHAAYGEAGKRAALVREQIRSLDEEVRVAGGSLEGVEKALAGLELGEDWRLYQEDLSRIRNLEAGRDEASRLYHVVAGTALHLFGKGEKIAARKKDRAAARLFRDAIALLEGELPLDTDAAGRVLPPAEGALTAMVALGDISPKNREESELLRVPGRLFRELTDMSGRFQEAAGEISEAREAASAHPAFLRSRELSMEKEDLERRISVAGGRLEAAKREAAELEDRARVLLDEVREKAGALSAEKIRVRDPGR